MKQFEIRYLSVKLEENVLSINEGVLEKFRLVFPESRLTCLEQAIDNKDVNKCIELITEAEDLFSLNMALFLAEVAELDEIAVLIKLKLTQTGHFFYGRGHISWGGDSCFFDGLG